MKSRLSTRLAAAEDMAAYRGVRVSLKPRYVPVATNPAGMAIGIPSTGVGVDEELCAVRVLGLCRR